MLKLEDQTPVLDINVIQQLRSIDPKDENGLVKRLVELYLESAPEIVSNLHKNLAESNLEHLRFFVHRFRTSNANLGLKRMYQILSYIESSELQIEDQKELVSQLDVELEKAVSALRELQTQ